MLTMVAYYLMLDRVQEADQCFQQVVRAAKPGEGFDASLRFRKRYYITPSIGLWLSLHSFSVDPELDGLVFSAMRRKPNKYVYAGAIKSLGQNDRNTAMNAFDYMMATYANNDEIRSEAIRAAMKSGYLPNPGGYFESSLVQFNAKDLYHQSR